nr:PAS domain S-box protein [Bacteroidota bacterium]
VWIEVTANLTLDTDGKLKGFQGISRNITPRKNFENGMLELVENLTLNDDILKLKNEELQRVRNEMEQIALKETLNSEKLASTICLMRNVFDAIPGGISVIDKDHNVIELNSKLLEIYGIPDRTEAIGKKCYKVFNCGNEPCATCSFPKLLKSPETIVRQATSDDKFLKGPSYRLYSSPMLDMSGEVVGMVETIVDISDLILAQTALMESEKDFEVFFNEVPDAIFITKLGNNSTGKIINVNPAAELLTGYTKDELIGKNILADISIATPEETIRREQNLSSDGRIEFTEQKRRKDGTLVWTEVVIQKIRFKGSSISLSISRDISVRKIAEEKLRTSELQNRNLLNAIPDLLFVFDNNGTFKDFHANKQESLFLHPEQFLNKKIQDVLPTHISGITLKMIAKTLETGYMQIYEYSNIHKGKKTHHEARMVRSDSDEVLVLVRDITTRKISEEELNTREKKYSTIFKHSPVGLFNFSEDGVIVDCNENFVQIIGSSREVLVGLNMLDQLNDRKLKKALRDALNSGSGFYDGFYKSTTADKLTPVKVFFRVIRDQEGKFIDGIGIVENVSEQKKYEEQIISAKEKAEESDKMKSAFMATMSHELRTPLNAVIGFSEMLESELPSDQIVELAQLIKKSGQHLHDIIENIFDITQIESGSIKTNLEKITVYDTLQTLKDFCENEKVKAKKEHIDIHIDIPENLKTLQITADPHKLYKILVHLLSNAIKFTRQGYVKYGISTESHSGREVDLLFYIEDTGVGIAEDKLDIIFDTFRQADDSATREFEGTGLGLAITKKLVNYYGGTIWVKSKPGKGSTFYFELPCLTPISKVLEIVNSQISALNGNRGSSTILIAEDDDTNFQLFELLLRKENMRVIRANNGQEAVDIFRIEPDIDLVLMDINLPVMNGYEATKKIKEINPDISVLAVSAYTMAGDETKAREAGCNDYIAKPINNRLFSKTVMKYLH